MIKKMYQNAKDNWQYLAEKRRKDNTKQYKQKRIQTSLRKKYSVKEKRKKIKRNTTNAFEITL